MKIKDILKEKTPHISFEVFPPKTDAGFASVLSATDQIETILHECNLWSRWRNQQEYGKYCITYQGRLGTYQSGASDMRFFYKRTCSTRN